MSHRRAYLFLQGVCSPFFSRLADRLEAEGHRVYKINFSAGDWLYWRRRGARNFRGPLDSLEELLEEHYQNFEITDQILFGDRRPIHLLAASLGKACDIRTHVFEEGYFRPHWVTLEREGVNGHSLLPRDPAWFLDAGRHLPEQGAGQAFPSYFFTRAMHDVAYHAAGICNPLWFPHYRTHAPVGAVMEYAGYARQLPRGEFRKAQDESLINRWIRDSVPYFFMPLQLGSDAQILDHSRFDDMVAVLNFVLASFAKCAPSNNWLLIKNHPLDTGQANYPRRIRELVERLDLQGRVDYVEMGDLDLLLRHARGTVTVNSTVGVSALGCNCPTIALGDPIYRLRGLTFEGGLDDFWSNPTRPDEVLFRCFRNAVIRATQINGGFYSREGIALAVENSRRVLEADRSPLEELL